MPETIWFEAREFKAVLERNRGRHYVYAIGVHAYKGANGVVEKYVGKGINLRALAHAKEAARLGEHRQCARHRGIIKWGNQVRYAILAWCETGAQALAAEVAFIREFGRPNLWNHTDGGDAVINLDERSLARRSQAIRAAHGRPEYKALRSALSMEAWRDKGYRERLIEKRRAKAQDPDWIIRMKEVSKAAFGTPEIRAIRRRTARGVLSRPAVKMAISASSKANWSKPEFRENLSAHRKAMWGSLGFRERTRAAMKDAASRPEVKRKVSEASARNWANPEYAARMSDARRRVWASPEYRARMSEIRRKAMECPERRAAASLRARVRGLYSRLTGVPYRSVSTREAMQYLVESGRVTADGRLA